jgi:hypothetical protein
MTWRCFFGFHRWHQNKPFDGSEGFPDAGYRRWVRVCSRCRKRQTWLPGYGGSEWGCWLNSGRGVATGEEPGT